MIPGKEIAKVIDIESYKKYNLEGDEEIEEEGEEEEEQQQKVEKIEEDNVVTSQGCCYIF